MEIFRKYFTIKRSVGIWEWLGRVAPLTALMILCIILAFDFTSWISYLVSAIALLFAITAFTWWWWVIYAVKDIFRLLNSANKRFAEVLVELKNIKKDTIKIKKRKKR
jgi:hypothetical protein